MFFGMAAWKVLALLDIFADLFDRILNSVVSYEIVG